MSDGFLTAAQQWLSGIVFGPPIWVWPLLILLIFLGLRASRTRTSSVIPFYFLPLLGMISLRSVSSLNNAELAWLCFGAGYLAAAIGAYRIQSRWILNRTGNRLTLAGEWLSMITFMIIFWANFVRGTLMAVNPEIYDSWLFSIVFPIVVGCVAGTFLGRSIRVIRG